MAVIGKAHRDSNHLLVVFLRDALALSLRLALLLFLRLALLLPAPHLLLEYLVVDLALPGVGKNGVGVADFLECRVRLRLAAKVAVGVPLHRGTAVGALDLVQGGVRLHAEGRVEGGHGQIGRLSGGRLPGGHPS
ncbi:hypothetical protein D3C72_1916890 [compost metagenome]